MCFSPLCFLRNKIQLRIGIHSGKLPRIGIHSGKLPRIGIHSGKLPRIGIHSGKLQSWSKIFRPIADLQEKLTFQAIWKVLIFSLEMTRLLKIEKWLEDWPLGCHPARNGHVTQ